MPSITRLYDFQPGSPALSSQVDDEFNQLVITVNQLPDKDGSLQTNLNADLLDGFHADIEGGANKIPVCNSAKVQAQLNADLLDGQHASDISAAAFDAGTKLLFYQAAPPGGWTEVAKPTDHILGWKTGQAGGTVVANSWAFSGVTLTINEHVLTQDQIPIHNHSIVHSHTMPHTHNMAHTNNFTIKRGNAGSGGVYGLVELSSLGSVDINFAPTSSVATTASPSVGSTAEFAGSTGNRGSGLGHTHTGTAAGSTWRPPTAYIIIASKD